ncbi:hypothetical protein fHeYen902_196 [Yersinia phage fHe-Yen9-02]|nr:hypothetical protein fHeYen902_196 [Yersinia phage fHe-Yen9-02]
MILATLIAYYIVGIVSFIRRGFILPEDPTKMDKMIQEARRMKVWQHVIAATALLVYVLLWLIPSWPLQDSRKA